MDFNRALIILEVSQGREKVINFKDDSELEAITADLNARAKKKRRQLVVTKIGRNQAKVTSVDNTTSQRALQAATKIAAGLGI